MLAPNQLIEIQVVGRTLKHYRNLGYDVGVYDIIMVPPEHLPSSSGSRVLVICDVCGKEFDKIYSNYIRQRDYDMDVCKPCSTIKRKMTNKIKYGTEWAIQNDEIKLKAKQTCIDKYGVEYNTLVPEARAKARQTIVEKYGVEHPVQNEDIKAKMQKTSMERYGCVNPMQNSDIQEKSKQTVLQKYGVDNPFASPEIQDKIKQHYLDKYGVTHPSQVPEIYEKIIQSLTENGTGKASKQQKQLYEMIKTKYADAQINYPFLTCSLDVYVVVHGVPIDVEYDGSYWHQDKLRDIRRDKFLQSHGLKTLRVRSGNLLPTKQELFDAIDYLVNTEHHFKEIILSDWKEKEEEECQKQLQVAQ